jgi:hypothetical protein
MPQQHSRPFLRNGQLEQDHNNFGAARLGTIVFNEDIYHFGFQLDMPWALLLRRSRCCANGVQTYGRY